VSLGLIGGAARTRAPAAGACARCCRTGRARGSADDEVEPHRGDWYECNYRLRAYEQAIRRLRRDVEIVAKSTPLFVPLAEEGWLDNEVAEAAARRYLVGLADEGVDTLLLGCTHFPLLARVMGRVLVPTVGLVDSSEETAASAGELLAEQQLLNPGGPVRHRFYLSDLAPNFQTVGERFLGEPMGEVMRASVGETLEAQEPR